MRLFQILIGTSAKTSSRVRHPNKFSRKGGIAVFPKHMRIAYEVVDDGT
jgi:hypothetical protein